MTFADRRVRAANTGRIRASLVSVACLLRSAPLFVRAVPRTPLRVLCIVALDTVRVLRYGRPFSRERREALAMFLDFQAGTNAIWDGKDVSLAEYRALQRRLEKAGLGSWMTEYMTRVGRIESRRPSFGVGRQHFDDVRAYREAVVRLSLATITAIALDAECLGDAIRATERDGDVAPLFGMAMQCQIIDDVVDYREDLSAGLPSFLTAAASPALAMALTAEAARSYAVSHARAPGRGVFPLDVALRVVSAAAKVVIAAARRTRLRSELIGTARRAG